MANGLSNWMLKAQVDALCKWNRMKDSAKEEMHSLLTEEKGSTGIIEIVLILVVVVGLAIIFRDKITGIVTQLWDGITGKTDTFDNF